jgi:hypothetical protein
MGSTISAPIVCYIFDPFLRCFVSPVRLFRCYISHWYHSVRNTPAYRIIQQVEQLIGSLRISHPHLTGKNDISVVCTFPCYKPTSHFQSITTLISNINAYNAMLVDSSVRFNFSILNLHITADQLKVDGMHVHSDYRSWVCNAITAHCTTTLDTHRTLTQSRHRSRAALTRRNNKRHKRSAHQRMAYNVTRPIDRSWKLQHIKNFLKQREIKYSRLPEIYHHQLRIFFNSAGAQQHADQILAPDDFNERNYQNWLSQQQL